MLTDFVASLCFVRCEVDRPALEAKQFSLWLFYYWFLLVKFF